MSNNENIKTTKNTNIETLIIPNNIEEIKAFEFSNYPNLKKVVIPNSVTKIGNNAFSNCPNLIAVKLPDTLFSIGNGAFQNCPSLKYINFPETLEIIEDDAFKNCSSITKIYIPSNLKKIGNGAFHKTPSCEKIEVSKYNKKYQAFNDIALIDIEFSRKLVLYAGGSKNNTFDFTKYCVSTINNNEVITEVEYIDKYAFCGNPYLEKLILPSCTSVYERTAFEDCINLKYLDINGITFSPKYDIYINDNGWALITDKDKPDTIFPFEHITINGYIYQFNVHFTSKPFKNLKTLNIKTTTSFTIGKNCFYESCPDLKIYFNNNICNIEDFALNKNSTIIVNDNREIKNIKSIKVFNEQLGTYIQYSKYNSCDDIYLIEYEKRLFSITKTQIENTCKNSNIIVENPTTFLDFINDMKNHEVDNQILLNGIIIKHASCECRNILFEICKKNDTFSKNVLEKSRLLEIDDDMTEFLLSSGAKRINNYLKILKDNNITDEIFYDRLFASTSKYVDYDYLFKNHYQSLLKIIKCCNLTSYGLYNSDEAKTYKYTLRENSDTETDNTILDKIFYKDYLTKYIKLIDFLNIKNNIIFNESIITSIDNPLMIKFLVMLDANFERLLRESKVLDKNDTASQNIHDLLNLLHITNAFDNNPIYRQKVCTFLTEKIFASHLGNGDINVNQIVGNNIHRIFAFNDVKSYSNKEFATLFLENYQRMLQLEKTLSGTINDIYENFEDISKVTTSDKGMQRKLKVTLDKCIHYLYNKSLKNVQYDSNEMAYVIGKWYTDDEVQKLANAIYKESLNAPRNIFTKRILKDEEIIYDNSPINDLKEKLNENFSYEWLIKQDYNNLILGKFCNCCSHVNGAGQGIMRASMISEDHQNLVIKNRFGEIVSKATIYVDRRQGYAVYNTIETKIEYQIDKTNLEHIYNALIRGTEAFVNRYNQNNEENKIKTVTIGTKGNSLNDILENNEDTDAYTYRAPLYSRYSLTDKLQYDGDCHGKQKILLKEK